MSKFFQIIIWIVVFVCIVITLAFVSKSQDKMLLKQSPIVNIAYETDNRFINKEDILNQIINQNRPTKQISSFNISEIEKKINNNSFVKKAQVFRTVDGNLVVNVQQKKPMVRIYTKGESYYMDENGFLMLISKKYTARVPIVNGFLNEPFSKRYTLNYANLHDTLATKTMLDDIYKISKYIYESSFWNAQIEQVYVNKDLELVLIPKVGNHKIVFGGIDHLDSKFKKLMIFYQKALQKTGWNEYAKINLKYKNQVVCTKIYN